MLIFHHEVVGCVVTDKARKMTSILAVRSSLNDTDSQRLQKSSRPTVMKVILVTASKRLSYPIDTSHWKKCETQCDIRGVEVCLQCNGVRFPLADF
jgi:hypothetical protein